jgi:two-component system sensor histidine kinase KdpD
VIGQLIKITKRQYAALHLRLERLTMVEQLSKDLFSLPSIDEVLGDSGSNFNDYKGLLRLVGPTILNEISKIIVKFSLRVVRANCMVLFRDWNGNLKIWFNSDLKTPISNQDLGVANWTYVHSEPAGSGTNTLKDTQMFFLPLITKEKCIGVIGFKYNFQNLLPEQKNILSAICNLSALAAARWVNL